MKPFAELQSVVMKLLSNHSLPHLYYHSPGHTLDVMNAAILISGAEKVSESDQLKIKTAALLHDAGYTRSYKNHEESSCIIAKEMLPAFGYDTTSVAHICELIMATKIPHQPKDKLAEILCDADLDYLGRDDFFSISDLLFREFSKYGIVNSEEEWNKLQLNFLKSHQYFTQTATQLRNAKKQDHVEMIARLVV